jgi:hypothetical protein
LDQESLECGIWYPDEEICHLQKFHSLDWVKKQKKLVRVGVNPAFYFDIKMLKKLRRISLKTKGEDPDAGVPKKEKL